MHKSFRHWAVIGDHAHEIAMRTKLHDDLKTLWSIINSVKIRDNAGFLMISQAFADLGLADKLHLTCCRMKITRGAEARFSAFGLRDGHL